MAKGQKKEKTLEAKIREIDGSFVEEVYSATSEQLKDRLLALATFDEENDKLESEDDDLKVKKETAREAAKAYSEPRAANKLKRKLIVTIMQERGKA